ncbi:MAG: hypothetical protein INH41_09250 [Myxococcaceae bacterium]|jgi:hypothetical protein|nr:hypothetical protein [Myxococcaceae bacterium]MCA3012571.1 hypothetical protein [Myxococcaceae bacterium]
MPAFLTYLTAVERLAAHVNSLPQEFSRALGEDLEYARFGAALVELPWFGGLTAGVHAWRGQGVAPAFSRLMRERAPVAFGVKAAELVSNGALVGTEAGLAFVAGYFTQLCVGRALEPVVQALVATHAGAREAPPAARHRIEWAQSLALMQELHGSPLVGTSAIRTKMQIRKASGVKGVGRGLYELMRVSSQEAFGEAPSKLEVDGWVRGFFLFAMALGSPLGRLTAGANEPSSRELYRGPGVDVFAALDLGLDATREVLSVLGSMIRRNNFGARSRFKLLEVCPEGSPEQVMRARAA